MDLSGADDGAMGPGCFLGAVKIARQRGRRMSLTKVDFPLPETPVTQTNVPRGKWASTLRRLFSRAPVTLSHPSVGPATKARGVRGWFLLTGTRMRSCPLR